MQVPLTRTSRATTRIIQRYRERNSFYCPDISTMMPAQLQQPPFALDQTVAPTKSTCSRTKKETIVLGTLGTDPAQKVSWNWLLALFGAVPILTSDHISAYNVKSSSLICLEVAMRGTEMWQAEYPVRCVLARNIKRRTIQCDGELSHAVRVGGSTTYLSR